MARTPLYSRSPSRPTPAVALPVGAQQPNADNTPLAPLPRWQQFVQRRERWLWLAGVVLLAVLAGWPAWTAKIQRALTLEQIDAALRESIAKEPLPSAYAAAYAAVLPSVVRVVGEHGPPPGEAASAAGSGNPPGANANPKAEAKPGSKASSSPAGKPETKADGKPEAEEDGRSVGTGVVIVDKGLILTNLHVVAGARKITVTFADGSESEATIVSLQPKDDLAVLQAKTIPDDLHAATMRSTSGLSPGDEVVAVGFPFGIGPSASAGVISGLKREFRSPEGQRVLSNLIQFDAAANPGNSGGPLITLDGHVVGIVTAIMNPNRQRTFIGIGFAVPIENAAGAAGLPPF